LKITGIVKPAFVNAGVCRKILAVNSLYRVKRLGVELNPPAGDYQIRAFALRAGVGLKTGRPERPAHAAAGAPDYTMDMKKILMAVAALGLAAAAQAATLEDLAASPAGFASLYAADLSGLESPKSLPGINIPAAKAYAVDYTLRGVLTRSGDKTLFNTPDGRLFELKISAGKARRYDGRSVEISARATAADQLSVLKVSRIEEYRPGSQEVQLPPYSALRKPARIVSGDGAAAVVENVRWNYDLKAPAVFDWATATIKPELVKNIYFVKKPFAPEWLAAHSLFAFSFEDGGLTDAAGNKAGALVLSIEAYLRDGQSYSLTDGLKNKFSIVWQLTTWEEYSARTVYVEKQRLIPYPVTLGHEQKAALLREALRQAAVNREGEYYHTVTNNCTNNLVILMNHVLPENRRIKPWTIPALVYNLNSTMPIWVPGYLQKKGLLGAELPPVNEASFPVMLP